MYFFTQDNQIQTLDSDGSGVSTLVNLKSLQIGNNRIRSIDEFQVLDLQPCFRTEGLH